MPKQLPLPFMNQVQPRFANFVCGPNQLAVDALRQWASTASEWTYLYGGNGTGVTHLLLAATALAAELSGKTIYLSLREDGLTPESLIGLEQFGHIALDDIDVVAGQSDWELALFSLCNAVKDNEHAILFGAHSAPERTGWRLPDLRSRLQSAARYRLKALADEERLIALQQHLADRGLSLSDEAGRYLLRRGPRDMRHLLSVIERLDHASLVQKRPLTVPFIRDVMGWSVTTQSKENQDSPPHGADEE
jgi:DnaA family protein